MNHADFDQDVYNIVGNGCFTALPESNVELDMLALREYLKNNGKQGDELTLEEREKFIIKKRERKAL